MSGRTERPDASEHATCYAGYIAAVADGDIVSRLREHGRALAEALAAVPDAREGFRYAEGKWTIRDVVGHIVDAERIFAYRALRLARGDATPLAGFDEGAYAAVSNASMRPLAELRAELLAVRESTVSLLASLDDVAWTRGGNANGQPISVRALAWIAAGHAMHHHRILSERYGVPA